MFHRRLSLPPRSFFLLGPRGTGKTTWSRERLPKAHWYNLLLDRELIRLPSNPAVFRQELDALPKLSKLDWVVLAEIQRLPELLNEVHDVLSPEPRRLAFALTGSSARKLRRGNVKLLAGRALTRLFFPLVAAEFGADRPLDSLLRFGCLPAIRTEPLVKNLDSFTRFLEVAALMNAQVVNLSAIARDAGVPRPTVQGYFEILTDTLIGVWLPAYRPRARVKQVAHPKFYFFDTGVARALSSQSRESLSGAERGPLFETYLLHELRAHIHDLGLGGELSYWRTASGTEVDFVWTRGTHTVALEAKCTPRWRTADGRPLRELTEALRNARSFVVYTGDRRLKDGPIEVLPVAAFLKNLYAGKILPAP